MKKEITGIKVLYNPDEFKNKGFDGEIAKVMRENKQTAIVGGELGIDRHVIQFYTHKDWSNYCKNNPYSKNLNP